MARRERKQAFTPHIGYSTNVHKSRDLAGVYRFLRDYTLPIKHRVFGRERAGLELHLNIGSTRDLQNDGGRRKFSEFLEREGLVPFSVNAYPLLDFHARRVKETVYQPSWAENERAHWTSVIAEVLADLLPPDVSGSISTLGGCFRPHCRGPATFRRMAVNYLKSLRTFLEIEEKTGRRIVLAVEPEPDTAFETCDEVIRFFEDYLAPAAFERWKRRGTRAKVEADLRRVFAVNLDTCHLSVLFEDQVKNQRRLARAGIRLGKVHVTNAVALRNPFRASAGFQDLRAMDEPQYFHQFCGRDASGKVTWRGVDLHELPKELDRQQHPAVSEIRSHFHVPLYLKRYRRLYTTQADTETALREVIKQRSCDHLVLETYTWPIIAGKEHQREKLVDGIVREYRWLLSILKAGC